MPPTTTTTENTTPNPMMATTTDTPRFGIFPRDVLEILATIESFHGNRSFFKPRAQTVQFLLCIFRFSIHKSMFEKKIELF